MMVVAEARVLRTPRHTVATLRVLAVLEHADERQTSLDFGEATSPAESVVHAIDAGELLALAGRVAS